MAVIVRKPGNTRKQYTVRYQVTGKQRERSFSTSREARDFKIKVEHDARAQIFIDPDVRTSLTDYFTSWIETHAVTPGTKRTYLSIFANHIAPKLAR